VPPDTTAPSVPTGLTATAVSASQINLSWTASTDPPNTSAQISYNVYRNGTKVATTAAGTTTYQDTGLAASTTYNYTVSAVDPAKNTSAQTAPVSATTQAPPPIAPGNYTTAGGYQATVSVQSSDGTMWLGTVVVNGISVPTFWSISGVSQNPAFSLP
jgi:chitodextrinase